MNKPVYIRECKFIVPDVDINFDSKNMSTTSNYCILILKIMNVSQSGQLKYSTWVNRHYYRKQLSKSQYDGC